MKKGISRHIKSQLSYNEQRDERKKSKASSGVSALKVSARQSMNINTSPEPRFDSYERSDSIRDSAANIKVAVRVRPLRPKERRNKQQRVI